MHFERHFAFQIAKNYIFFFRELVKKPRFHQLITVGSGYPNHRYFFIWPKQTKHYGGIKILHQEFFLILIRYGRQGLHFFHSDQDLTNRNDNYSCFKEY